MHKSEVVSRQVPAPAAQHLSRFDHGTRVTVRNLFGNMPVRVKQRAIISEKQSAMNKEWESLKSSLVLLLLAWPDPVALNLRELSTNQKMIIRGPSKFWPSTEASSVCQILSQSSFITPEENASWVSVVASTSSLNVSGIISLDPSPTKHVQFISFDIHPLLALEGQSILHDEINRLFSNSAFGNEEEGEELGDVEMSRRAKDARYKGDGYTNRELKGGKKGVDRWPMFYINIERMKYSTVSKAFDIDDILDDKASSLSAITKLLQAMILEFLTRHQFRPKAPRSQRSKIFEGEPDQEAINGLVSPQRDHKTVTFAKSPSTKGPSPRPAIVEKKKPTKIRSTDLDLLSATVKLPSFRRSSSTSESPFDGWSRTKIGTAKRALERTIELSSAEDIQRPSTAPPASLSPAVEAPPTRSSTPLICSTGKVIRRPFEDIPTQRTGSKSTPRSLPAHPSQSKTATLQPTTTPIGLTQDDAEDMVAWMNPITKVKSLINKRTGHTVPVVNTSASRSSARSLFSPIPLSQPTFSNSQANFKSSEPSPWLSNLVEKWDNPVFRPTEPSIPQASLSGGTDHVLHGHRHNCSQLDIDRAFQEVSSGISSRISKAALSNVEVIGQVDRKFILVNVSISEVEQEGRMLVIIDQHAADERIRVESLLAELCRPPQLRPDGVPSESGIFATYLDTGLVFEVSDKDVELLRTQRSRFADWGILYDIPTPRRTKASTANKIRTEPKPKQKFTVRALPPGIVERCKSDPKLLIDLIRTELYSPTNPPHSHNNSTSTTAHSSQPPSNSWLTKIHTCPRPLLEMLNSRACRSAVMFNDVLSKEHCEVLVKRLAQTAFPFQCAHGRPSLLPLIEVGSVPQWQASVSVDERAGGGELRRELRRWKAGMGK
jgi:DNA mismatch repair protein MLH3